MPRKFSLSQKSTNARRQAAARELQRRQRTQDDRERRARSREARNFDNFTSINYNCAAFNYDSQVDYSSHKSVTIGSINKVCEYCNALKFSTETPGFYCRNGKVKLPALNCRPELVSGTSPQKKHFLKNIQDLSSWQKKRKIADEDKVTQRPEMYTTEGDALSMSWGSQYNQMEAAQKIIARKIISDVLFQGCVGSLQMEQVVQVNNIFNGQYAPGPNDLPHHILKRPSTTSTPKPKISLRPSYEEYSRSAQPQSPFVVYERNVETVVSNPIISEQFIDTGDNFDLPQIKDEFIDEEQ